MAIQTGSITFRGKIGNVVGRKLNGKHIISTPGGFTSEGLARGKKGKYKRVFQMGSEFKMSVSIAKSIYHTMKGYIPESHFSDNAFSRLNGTILLTRRYSKHKEGKRRPSKMSMARLRNFCFNPLGSSIWRARPSITQLSEEEGSIILTNPEIAVHWPFEADRLRLTVVNLETDLKSLQVANSQANYIEIDTDNFNDPIQWTFPTFPQNNLTALAVQFFQVVQNDALELYNMKYNAFHILDFKE